MLIDKVRALSDTPKVNEVAEALGIPPQRIRVGLQRQILPIGFAVQVTGKKRWSYCIFKDLLINYLEGVHIKHAIADARERSEQYERMS